MKKLDKKKSLAARVLKVGRGRIIFEPENLTEIKEAITKQDIKDLLGGGAIKIREKSGKKKKIKKKTRRGAGKIKKKIKKRKQTYVKLTRKLRRHIKKIGEISRDKKEGLRKKIKSKLFKSKAHFKEHIENEIR